MTDLSKEEIERIGGILTDLLTPGITDWMVFKKHNVNLQQITKLRLLLKKYDLRR